jgi:hypothetical protein
MKDPQDPPGPLEFIAALAHCRPAQRVLQLTSGFRIPEILGLDVSIKVRNLEIILADVPAPNHEINPIQSIDWIESIRAGFLMNALADAPLLISIC